MVVAQVPAQVVGSREKLPTPPACDDTHVIIVPLSAARNQTLREGLLALSHKVFRAPSEQSPAKADNRETSGDEHMSPRFGRRVMGLTEIARTSFGMARVGAAEGLRRAVS
jgi:hypothetical protein